MGVSALVQLNVIFREQHGRTLDAAFAVLMPVNFPPLFRPPVSIKCDRILEAADKRLSEIAHVIDQGLIIPPGFAPFSALMKTLTYGSFARTVHGADKDFSVSDECTSCGTCVQVCPAGNITIVNERPVWNHRCELCCACLHFCPTEAIQLNVMRGTKNRGRYLHPDLKVSDMRVQQGEISYIS